MVPEPKQSGFRTRSAHHDLTSLAVRVPRRAPALPRHILAAPINPRRGRKGPEAFRKHECVSTVGFDEISRAGYLRGSREPVIHKVWTGRVEM